MVRIGREADVAVVGAGIVGLAVALECARAGKHVVLFERDPVALGASIRNFGQFWALGQPEGPALEAAWRSRAIWLELAREARFFIRESGSLCLARNSDEWRVLEEFQARSVDTRPGLRLVGADEAAQLSPAARREGLQGGLYSPYELTVDPREAIRRIPQWLAEKYGVVLRLGCPVGAIEKKKLRTADGIWRADKIFVCTGSDFRQLYPEVLINAGLALCKLQMLRTAPQPADWTFGPTLTAGLTLLHYASFEGCPSLPALQRRLESEHPFCLDNGIHVMASGARDGSVTVGDSHHYGPVADPFDRLDVEQAILDYLDRFVRLPVRAITERWHGVYAKAPGRTHFLARPESWATVVNGLGGNGMTLAFGMARDWVNS